MAIFLYLYLYHRLSQKACARPTFAIVKVVSSLPSSLYFVWQQTRFNSYIMFVSCCGCFAITLTSDYVIQAFLCVLYITITRPFDNNKTSLVAVVSCVAGTNTPTMSYSYSYARYHVTISTIYHNNKAFSTGPKICRSGTCQLFRRHCCRRGLRPSSTYIYNAKQRFYISLFTITHQYEQQNQIICFTDTAAIVAPRTSTRSATNFETFIFDHSAM